MTPDDNPPQAILDLVHRIRDIGQRAMQQYQPVVDDILRSGSRDVRYIEHTLDGLLDFCGHAPMLLLYRQVCRHYWKFDPAATAFYINAYRERWDGDISDVGDKRFAIIIDKANSGQGGKTSAAVSQALGTAMGKGADSAAAGNELRELKTALDGVQVTDTDRVAERIQDDIARKVAADTVFQNAGYNTPHNARMAHDKVAWQGDAAPASPQFSHLYR